MVPNFASRFALAIVSLAISHFVSGRSFQVVAYNVENLFDTDGVSLYDDYKPEFYGQVQNKLNSIVRSLKPDRRKHRSRGGSSSGDRSRPDP